MHLQKNALDFKGLPSVLLKFGERRRCPYLSRSDHCHLKKVKYGSDGTFVQSRHHRQTSSVCCTEGRQAVEMTLKEIFFEIIIFIGYRTYEKT